MHQAHLAETYNLTFFIKSLLSKQYLYPYKLVHPILSVITLCLLRLL